MDSLLKISRYLLSFFASVTWSVLLKVKVVLCFFRSYKPKQPVGIASGKTVLVTTGRQTKTLHIIRALKNIGATVIVTDYHPISSSALSLACDEFVLLPSLDTSAIDEWIESFYYILMENKVDVVLPVSTINEVLFIGLAKMRLQDRAPHIKWLCPDLNQAIILDDRAEFSRLCSLLELPTPDNGVLLSADCIEGISRSFEDGVILKRIESSSCRSREIVHVCQGDAVPNFVSPSSSNPWQWQRFVVGDEFSVWYVCVDGIVTFSACYHNEMDLVQFDPAEMNQDLDGHIRRLIKHLNYTGQVSFDFIREQKTGVPYVIECNPRASSILETASNTPLWAEAFFGIDVSKRTLHQSIGFVYHMNCWPWCSRSEGNFLFSDPLPFFGGEVAWPMNAIAEKGLTRKFFEKVDVNICKIIVSGPSVGRELRSFYDLCYAQKLSIARQALQTADTLFLDMAIPEAEQLLELAKSQGITVISFKLGKTPLSSGSSDDVFYLPYERVPNDFFAKHATGEARVLLRETLSHTGYRSSISYRVVEPFRTWKRVNEIPLRKLHVLHLMGSCTSEYYEGISGYFGFCGLKNVATNDRFEHIVAYVHFSGEWSVAVDASCSQQYSHEYLRNKAERLAPGIALGKIQALRIDVAVPHMFDYAGLTSYRGIFEVLGIPMIGCSGEALALSANKARTKACAAMAGVQVPHWKILRRGESASLTFPAVIKPNEEDNSQGVTMVEDESGLEAALEFAYQFGDEALCEQFIPLGREMRVALVENSSGELNMLPIIEYFFKPGCAIRMPDDKFTTDASDRVISLASTNWECPARVDEILRAKLYEASTKAHEALGCRDYSLFDFRIDPSGEPYLLESCLYCSFSPTSVLVRMQTSVGLSQTVLFERLCERAMARRNMGEDCCVQQTGMKHRR